MLGTAERDLHDCRTPGLRADWRFNIAYSAILGLASAALAACGYRASREGHHYWTIQSLGSTLGLEPDVIDELDAFRKKRNIATYEETGYVSDKEADEIINVAEKLRAQVVRWLKEKHRDMVD